MLSGYSFHNNSRGQVFTSLIPGLSIDQMGSSSINIVHYFESKFTSVSEI